MAQADRRGLTPPNSRAPGCWDPRKCAGVQQGLGLPGTRTSGFPEVQPTPSLCLGCSRGLGRRGPRRWRARGLRGSRRPRVTPRGSDRGRTTGPPGSQHRSPQGGPGPPGLDGALAAARRSAPALQFPAPAPPGAAPLGPYLSVSRAARPSPALRGASSPRLLNGAGPRRSAGPDATNRAADAPVPGQPSAELSRRRPLAPAAAPAGLRAPPGFANTGAYFIGGETESQGKAGPQMTLVQTAWEPRILPTYNHPAFHPRKRCNRPSVWATPPQSVPNFAATGACEFRPCPSLLKMASQPSFN